MFVCKVCDNAPVKQSCETFHLSICSGPDFHINSTVQLFYRQPSVCYEMPLFVGRVVSNYNLVQKPGWTFSAIIVPNLYLVQLSHMCWQAESECVYTTTSEEFGFLPRIHETYFITATFFAKQSDSHASCCAVKVPHPSLNGHFITVAVFFFVVARRRYCVNNL